jgi:hypothetical protein
MAKITQTFLETASSEEGHAAPALAGLVGGVGAIVLGIGAANGTDWMAIGGGIAAGAGIIGYVLLQHAGIEYDIYRRLENLEGKK